MLTSDGLIARAQAVAECFDYEDVEVRLRTADGNAEESVGPYEDAVDISATEHGCARAIGQLMAEYPDALFIGRELSDSRWAVLACEDPEDGEVADIDAGVVSIPETSLDIEPEMVETVQHTESEEIDVSFQGVACCERMAALMAEYPDAHFIGLRVEDGQWIVLNDRVIDDADTAELEASAAEGIDHEAEADSTGDPTGSGEDGITDASLAAEVPVE